METNQTSSPFGIARGSAQDVIVVVPFGMSRSRTQIDHLQHCFNSYLPKDQETDKSLLTAEFLSLSPEKRGIVSSSDFYVTFPSWVQSPSPDTNRNSTSAKLRRLGSSFLFYSDYGQSDLSSNLSERLKNGEGKEITEFSSDYSINVATDDGSNDISPSATQSNRGPITGNVQVQINGRIIPDLEMNFPMTPNARSCKFVIGNGWRPSKEALELLVGKCHSSALSKYERDNGRNDLCFNSTQVTHNGNGATLNFGRNLIRYTLFHQEKVLASAEAFLYMWSAYDSIIVCDVDGTVTKSDVRGVIDSVVQDKFQHVHTGICKFFNDLESMPRGQRPTGDCKENTERGQIRFFYLSSRPMCYISQTRKLLTSLSQECEELVSCMNSDRSTKCYRLPPGPIVCHRGPLSTVLHSELVSKNIHEFKADVLARQVVIPFVAARGMEWSHRSFSTQVPNEIDAEISIESSSDLKIFDGRSRLLSEMTESEDNRLFLAGFGNKVTDAQAYEMAGIEHCDIYIINKDSQITRMGRDKIAGSSDRSSCTSVSHTGQLANSNMTCDDVECIHDICCAGSIGMNVLKNKLADDEYSISDAIEASWSGEREIGQSISEYPPPPTVEIQCVSSTPSKRKTLKQSAQQSVRAFSMQKSLTNFPSFGSNSSDKRRSNSDILFDGYDDPKLLQSFRQRIFS